MNESFLEFIFTHPGFFFSAFVVHGLAGALIAYGIAYIFLRPKAGKRIENAPLYHALGMLTVAFGAAFFRVFAAATFGGREAYELPKGTFDASLYLLVVPFIISMLYLFWLKNFKMANDAGSSNTQVVDQDQVYDGRVGTGQSYSFKTTNKSNASLSTKRYEKALTAYNYRKEIRDAYDEMGSIPTKFKIEFINLLDGNPKIPPEQLTSAVSKIYNDWLNPYGSEKINNALNLVREIDPKAEEEFRKVVDLLGESTDIDELIAKIKHKEEVREHDRSYYLNKIFSKYGVCTLSHLLDLLNIETRQDKCIYNRKVYSSYLDAVKAADQDNNQDINKTISKIPISFAALTEVAKCHSANQ